MTKKRKNPFDDPAIMARLFRPLTNFQKAFGYNIVRDVPNSTDRVSKYEVRQLEAVQRALRKYNIETILAEWALWSLRPVQEKWTTKPNDKFQTFIWLDKVLIGAAFYGKNPGDVETAQFALGMTYILRAYLAANTDPRRPRSSRETYERVNFEHVMDDAAKSMPIALRRAEAGWRREIKRKAVRRGTA